MKGRRTGQTNPTFTERGRSAAPDYRELYFEMFRASEAAIRLLQQAQARAEEAYLASDPPPVFLPDQTPGSPPDSSG